MGELHRHVLNLRAVLVLALGAAAGCAAPPPDDAPPSAIDTDGDGRDGVVFAAPLRFVPGPREGTPRLVVVDATVEGHGEGLLVLEGTVVDASAGVLVLPEGTFTHDGRRMIPHSTEQIEIPGPGEPPRVLDLFSGRVDALLVREARRAHLVDHQDVAVELPLPLWVSGEALAWPAEGASIELSEATDETVHAHSPLMCGGGRTDDELGRDLRIAGAWAGAAAGEACSETEQCDGDLVCVIDLVDPTTRVCGACLPTWTDVASSPDVQCTDDLGCCDYAEGAECLLPQGVCVIATNDDGGDDDGGGCDACGDRDGDGVKNAWDAKPDESCSADADNDGCADSCDSDDDNCLVCSNGGIQPPNSLSVGMFVLLLLRGRGRRRRPSRTRSWSQPHSARTHPSSSSGPREPQVDPPQSSG